MTRSLKSLGLLVGAMLVLAGLVAQTASAHVVATFRSDIPVTTVRGVTDPGTAGAVFNVTGEEITCSIEEYHGVVEGEDVSSVTVTPTYTECRTGILTGLKVTGFGHFPEQEGAGPYCHYLIKANGTADLTCPAGKDVTVDAATCIIHVPAQNNLGTIEFRTDTKEWVGHVKHDLTLDIELRNITTNHTDGFACPLPSGGESATGTLVGKARVWGLHPETGTLASITWDPTEA